AIRGARWRRVGGVPGGVVDARYSDGVRVDHRPDHSEFAEREFGKHVESDARSDEVSLICVNLRASAAEKKNYSAADTRRFTQIKPKALCPPCDLPGGPVWDQPMSRAENHMSPRKT